MFIQNRLGLIESTETMLAQTQRLNQVSNNLANVDTTGYKKEDITFWEMLYQTNEDRPRVGKALKILTNYDEGPAEITGNQLDFAINGEGFFRLQTPDGIRYSRAGNFLTNALGQLVNPDGHLVMVDGGPLVIEGNDVSASSDGNLLVDGVPVGQLDVVTFENLTDLEKEGTNLFRLKEGGGPEAAPVDSTVKQGYLEGSNVNTINEMTNMIDLYRAYETQQKIMRTFDEMDGQAINTVGKLTG